MSCNRNTNIVHPSPLQSLIHAAIHPELFTGSVDHKIKHTVHAA